MVLPLTTRAAPRGGCSVGVRAERVGRWVGGRRRGVSPRAWVIIGGDALFDKFNRLYSLIIAAIRQAESRTRAQDSVPAFRAGANVSGVAAKWRHYQLGFARSTSRRRGEALGARLP